VGAAKAARVLAGVELGRRTLAVSPPAKLALRSADDLAALLVPRFGAHPTERVGVVMLDSRHRLMRVHLVSDGALDAALAVPRDVFREAAIAGAAAIAVFHNHPSGDPTPTTSDIELTRRLISAGRIVGIDVVDHLILVDGAYCSLRKAEVL
jgi:DNA repair protein RadC